MEIANITVQSVSDAFSPYVRNSVEIAHFQTVEQKAVISSLINCPVEGLSDYTDFQDRLTDWLLAGAGAAKDPVTVFLEKLEANWIS